MRFCSDAKCRFMSVNVCARLRLPCRLFQGDASLLNSQTGQMNCEVEMKLSKPVLASTGLAPNPLTHSLTHSLHGSKNHACTSLHGFLLGASSSVKESWHGFPQVWT